MAKNIKRHEGEYIHISRRALVIALLLFGIVFVLSWVVSPLVEYRGVGLFLTMVLIYYLFGWQQFVGGFRNYFRGDNR